MPVTPVMPLPVRHRSTPGRRRRTRALLAAVAVVSGLVVATPSTTQAAAPGGVPSVTATSVRRTVPTRDGTVAASVAVPDTPAPTASGRYPLVVFPATFAGELVDLSPLALALARHGYVTVYYLERGYGASTGRSDAAGPRDVADVQDVITWGLANTPADPARVGLVGLSYGAGLVLEAAAADSRVKAVSELSGWADLGRALYPNETPATVTRQALFTVATVLGRPSPEVRQNLQDAVDNVDVAGNLAFAAVRSPAGMVDRLAARRVPIFMGHAMNETIFPVDQTVDFFDAYTAGPKRLDLYPGDHGAQETQASSGVGGPCWDDAVRWLDAYVAGYDRSITTEPVVRVQPRSPNGPKPLEAWTSTSPTTTQRLYLATSRQLLGSTRTLQPTPGTGSQTVREGVNWLVHVPAPMYSYQEEVSSGRPPAVPLPLVDQSVSAIWRTAPLTTPMRLRGEERVHLSVTPSAAVATLVVHTLDVDELGLTGYLLAHHPVTFAGTPGRARTLDVTLPYNAYDLPAGHRLAVVVTTSDPSYTSANPAWSSIAVGPSSWVDVPLR